MLKQDKIKELYFDKKYKQIEIAKELNVSNKYVSKILLKDIRYKNEKARRKEISIKKHNKKKAESVIRKRKQKQNDYAILKNQHIQATLELSGGRKPIGNRAFRDWNTSIYRYDNKTKSYKLKSDIVATYDVPKKIKW